VTTKPAYLKLNIWVFSLRNNVLSSYLSQSDIDKDLRMAIIDHPELARTLPPEIYAEVLRGYRKGFRVVFLILAGLAVFAFLTAFFLMPHRDLDRPDDKELKQQGREFVAQLKAKKAAAVDEGKRGIPADDHLVPGQPVPVKV
jgi:hypothetical protein